MRTDQLNRHRFILIAIFVLADVFAFSCGISLLRREYIEAHSPGMHDRALSELR